MIGYYLNTGLPVINYTIKFLYFVDTCYVHIYVPLYFYFLSDLSCAAKCDQLETWKVLALRVLDYKT